MDDDCVETESKEVTCTLDASRATESGGVGGVGNMAEDVVGKQAAPGPAFNASVVEITVHEPPLKRRMEVNGNVNKIVNPTCCDWATVLLFWSNPQELHHKCRVRDEPIADAVRFYSSG